MAGTDTIQALPDTWVPAANENITAITFQHQGQKDDVLIVRATVGDVMPTDTHGVHYTHGFGERRIAPEDITPGAVGANRVWYRYESGPGAVFSSHS